MSLGKEVESRSKIVDYTIGQPLKIQTRWGEFMTSNRSTADGDIAVVVPVRHSNIAEDIREAFKITAQLMLNHKGEAITYHNFYPFVEDSSPYALEAEILKVKWYPADPGKH